MEGTVGKHQAPSWVQRLSHRTAGPVALRHMADMGSWVDDARVTAPADYLLDLRKYGASQSFCR